MSVFENHDQAMDAVLARIEELHSIPQIAVSVLNLTRDVDYDVKEVVACLENDPALAGKILRIVNSSRYGLRREVTNLRQAVAFMGQRSLRLVAMTFSLVDGLTRGTIGALCQAYWKRAITMATVAARIAKQIEDDDVDANDAYSAALLADVGILILAQVLGEKYAKMHEKLSHGEELIKAERYYLQFSHADLGGRLLEKWDFPAMLVRAARSHHDDPPDNQPLLAVVHVADLMADALWTPETPKLPIAKEFLNKRFGLNTDQFIELAIGTKDDIASAAKLFGIRFDDSIDCDLIRSRAQLQFDEAVLDVAAEYNELEQNPKPASNESTAGGGTHLGTALCAIYRESDPMRNGILAQFHEISSSALTLDIPISLAEFERVKIKILNEVQRFSREIEGTIRSCEPLNTRRYRSQIEFFDPLSSLEIKALMNAGLADKREEGTVWV